MIKKNFNKVHISRTSLEYDKLKILNLNSATLSTVIMDSLLRLADLGSKCTGFEGMC
jgi:hypothetical protein